MALIKVLIIFVVILALLNKRLPLYLAMIFGSLLMIVMFRLPIATAGAAHAHGLGRLVSEPCDVRDLGARLRA
mgnify:FL=1